jgi:diguanylate cyclase (GGDEF)-like protein
VATPALAAGFAYLSRSVRAGFASLGMLTSSAVLIHISGGYIEFHFHFFVMVGVMALYQDWVPFLIAIAYVVLHHGTAGVLDPTSVYNHPDAWAHPWKWAGVHGAFILAASVASLTAWRLNERLALRDSLTGLPNRVLFRDRLDHALARGKRDRETVAVLFLDLDDFKAVNDDFGHAGGDVLLASVARRLRGSLRSADTVARFGGDEFAVLLENSPGGAQAASVAEKLIAGLERPFVHEHGTVVIRVSVGIALGVGGEAEAAELLRAADVAMYRAKGAGEGRYVFFEPGMHTAAFERLRSRGALQRAVSRDRVTA